jgi:hypothetical protein
MAIRPRTHYHNSPLGCKLSRRIINNHSISGVPINKSPITPKAKITPVDAGTLARISNLPGDGQLTAGKISTATVPTDLSDFLRHWLPLLDAHELHVYFALGITGNLDSRLKDEIQIIRECQRVADIGQDTIRRCLRALKLHGLVT